MKKIFYLAVLAVLFGSLAVENRAEKVEIGKKFSIDKLSQEKKPADNTIIAFMPSLTEDCDYASMLTRSFYYYFDRRMAFEKLKKSPTTKIFLVVKDKMDLLKSAQNRFGEMTVIYDEKGELFSSLDIKTPSEKNADSTIILLDANDNVIHIDENYRAQGEHLKPLENKLKEANGIYEKVSLAASSKALKIGDKAPDFRVNDKEMLSDLRGKVILVSFYPAAFSGTLPKSETFEILKAEPSKFTLDDKNLMSCSFQIDGLDKLEITPEIKVEAKRIVVSSSTASLLAEWKKTLETENIEYTNDADYSISTKYFSYNANGYNNRVSVIVDKKGKIAYIDNNFELNDEAILNAKISELLRN